MDERYTRIRSRLEAMVDDPFDGQILRDLVPQGKRVTPALAAEPCAAAARRAMADSHGLPAFLAVDDGDAGLVLLVVDPVTPGVIGFRRPGDFAPAPHLDGSVTLGEVIAALREANDDGPDVWSREVS